MGYTDVIVRNMADRQEHALSTLGLLGEVREQVARL
jgi:hypothetical protein